MRNKLLFAVIVFLFAVNINAQTVAGEPYDMLQCEGDAFDLTSQNPEILNGLPGEEFLIAYFLTEENAEQNSNPILTPQVYIPEEYPQIIYARLTNVTDESFDVVSFHLNVFIWWDMLVTQPEIMQVCDDNDDDTAVIDLTLVPQDIIDNPNAYVITFHETYANAQQGTNDIVNTQSYVNIQVLPIHQIYIRIQDPNIYCFTIVEFQYQVSSEFCSNNIISGQLTFDDGNNECETDSTPAANIMVKVVNQNTAVHYTLTDSFGNYTFNNIQIGANEITALGQNTLMYQSYPESYTINAPGVFEGNNFCIGAANPYNDVGVYVYSTTTIPGFATTTRLKIRNNGNTVLSGEATMSYDDSMLIFNSTTSGAMLTGNIFTVPYTDLQPYEVRTFYFYFTVLPPPTVNQDDLIVFNAEVTSNEGDENISDNSLTWTSVVVNSFDPNDVTCFEGNFITEDQAQGYLTYMIRFQNTGNSDAINIKVEDILDEGLDFNTFQPLSSSHEYRLDMINNNVNFVFDNIYLPGEEVNEPESHGYIIYRIKPKAGAEIGDIFEATASIYFDFNEAIVTNTATTEIQSIMGLGENVLNQFALYPNPAKNIVNIAFGDSVANNVSISVSDISGKIVLAKTISNNENSFDVSALTSGMYFVTLTSDGKKQTKKLMIE